MPPLDDEAFLRRSFAVAKRAHEHYKHPFGAIPSLEDEAAALHDGVWSAGKRSASI